jgi:hypothetical protein
MKKPLLLVIVLIAVAVSGCMEKSPSGSDKSVGDLKTLSIKSADNLSSYSLKSSATQTMKLNSVGVNATPENGTTITESAETIASVNLSGFQVNAKGSTMNVLELPGKAANTSTTQAAVYQIGNSTYINDQNGKWAHLKDPRTAEAIWGQGNNNQVKALAEMINKSQAETIGSENINGIGTYKLKIITGSADYDNLYSTAFGIAAKLTQYPMFMPSINRTELNKTGVMEKMVWISKDTYLPVKYQSSLSFKMTPVIVGGMDAKTGQMKRFNQSMQLGEVSVNSETTDLYYDFNKPIEISLPEEALNTVPISSAQIQVAPAPKV